jgi:hypothetical protein
MPTKISRNLLFPRAGSPAAHCTLCLVLASLVASFVCASEENPASRALIDFVRSAADLIEQQGEAAFPQFRERGSHVHFTRKRE